MSILTKTFGIEPGSVVAIKLPAVALASVLGLFIFYGVGFAGSAEIHNAAHDGRHTFSFPCH